jgi:hypothetical protein
MIIERVLGALVGLNLLVLLADLLWNVWRLAGRGGP